MNKYEKPNQVYIGEDSKSDKYYLACISIIVISTLVFLIFFILTKIL